MKIQSATFAKGIVNPHEMLKETLPQIVFIGRSNVGKSSLINLLTKQKGLARTSALPGRTKEINTFLINHKTLFVDLPGYGFARTNETERDTLYHRINEYLFGPNQRHAKIILIMDAYVGPTKDDLEMLQLLQESKKSILVVLNKIDKIKKSTFRKHIQDIVEKLGDTPHLLVSTKTKTGIRELESLL